MFYHISHEHSHYACILNFTQNDTAYHIFFLHWVSLPRYILIICIHDTLCNVTCVVLVTTHFFISNAFFYLTFSLTELQMLLRCRLINISIIIVRHFLYLLYLCPCIDSGQFISYLCDLFFIFIFICIMINRLIS